VVVVGVVGLSTCVVSAVALFYTSYVIF
jgi:hypothetical protein